MTFIFIDFRLKSSGCFMRQIRHSLLFLFIYKTFYDVWKFKYPEIFQYYNFKASVWFKKKFLFPVYASYLLRRYLFDIMFKRVTYGWPNALERPLSKNRLIALSVAAFMPKVCIIFAPIVLNVRLALRNVYMFWIVRNILVYYRYYFISIWRKLFQSFLLANW